MVCVPVKGDSVVIGKWDATTGGDKTYRAYPQIVITLRQADFPGLPKAIGQGVVGKDALGRLLTWTVTSRHGSTAICITNIHLIGSVRGRAGQRRNTVGATQSGDRAPDNVCIGRDIVIAEPLLPGI